MIKKKNENIIEIHNGNKLKQEIINYVTKYPKCTFGELEKNIKGFKGDLAFGDPEYNIVYWIDLSIEAMEAISELIRDKILDVEEVPILTYRLSSDRVLNLPLAKMSRSYKTQRWLPLAFTVI